MLTTLTPDLDQCQGATVIDVAEAAMGLTEIAGLLGISRQRVFQLSQGSDFPAPLARLKMGDVWLTEDVETWARETGRLG